jgi:hypothetical protein
MLFGQPLSALVGNAQKILSYISNVNGSGLSVNAFGETPPTDANQSSSANIMFDTMWCFSLAKVAGAAAVRMQHVGPPAPPFHALVDPTTPAIAALLVFEDFVTATISALACETVFGFHEHITLGDKTTLVGIGFRAGADHIWHAFVNDCPTNVAPVTVRRDTTLAPLSTSNHRLSIVIDGRTKTISWWIDGVLVDSWTPGAPLDQMSAAPGPKVMWSMTCPINGAGTLRMHAGGIPQLRVMNLIT